jgi:hypothetical protein
MHKSIISQYIAQNQADDTTTTGQLCAYIESQNDVTTDIQNFYDIAWNIDTAQGVWLDYWGVWVGVGRYLTAPDPSAYWGVASDSGTFNNSVFYSADLTTNTYKLTDDVYRKLILLKAFSNISDCSIPTLNKILNIFFAGRGRVYASDNENMTISINFEFSILPWEYAVMTQSGVFPKPAGVRIIFTAYTNDMFGFDGQLLQTFNNGYLNK